HLYTNLCAVTCVWFILSKLASIFIIIKLRITEASAAGGGAWDDPWGQENGDGLKHTLQPHLLWSLDQSISTSFYDCLKAQQFFKTNTDITYLFFTHFICFGSPSF
ncbi:hypothetical protein ACJX0J_024152, partial [Zea mays]